MKLPAERRAERQLSTRGVWVDTALQRNPALLSTRIRAESGDADAGAREELERVAVQTEQAARWTC